MRAKKPSNSTLDAWWRKAVQKRWQGRCALCGNAGCECHHVVPRRRWATRWEPQNGVLLCVACHRHIGENPLEAARRLVEYVPATELERMSRKLKKDILADAGETENEWRVQQLCELKMCVAGYGD